MSILYKFLLFLCFACFTSEMFAQDGCFDCDYDSLKNQLSVKQTDDQKIKLLTLIIDLDPANSITTEDYINQLEKLRKRNRVDIAPYIHLREGIVFLKNKQPDKALQSWKNAVNLFDKNKKVISRLLSVIRVLYNSLDQQEERYKYYKAKLEYYLVNGPQRNIASCYYGIGGYYVYKGNYNLAISYYLRGAEEYKKFDQSAYMNIMAVVAAQYVDWGNFEKAKEYFNIVLPYLKKAQEGRLNKSYQYIALSKVSVQQHKYEEAFNYVNEALKSLPDSSYGRNHAISYLQKGIIFLNLNKPDEALSFLEKAKSIADTTSTKIFATSGAMEIDYSYYRYYRLKNNNGAAETFLLEALQKAKKESSDHLHLKYLRELSAFYGQLRKYDLASKYTTSYFQLADSMEQQQIEFKVAQYEVEQKEKQQTENINSLRQDKLVQEATLKQRNLVLYISFAALLLIAASVVFLYRQLAINKKVLQSLRKTQRQLIMSEKMASLGELTAGVAHEIQNPLNFVNNFSEVSTELVEEMKEELTAGNKDAAIAIAADLQQNLEKISHHGKRAESIVKGMLQHSRASSGKKESTDINELVDEYLRLSYHGLRAKDNSFNAAMETHYDDSVKLIDVVPQDLGRVFLNLFTNAFYSVNEKKRLADDNFHPTISITTKKADESIEIRIKDNGNGIPQKILDKIYQPFFTTKPTGEGTGLGLSLSYDIITKGHGGHLQVNTKEGEFAEFIITLPMN